MIFHEAIEKTEDSESTKQKAIVLALKPSMASQQRRFYISTFSSFWRIPVNKTGSMIKGMEKNEYSAFRCHEVTYCDKEAQSLMEGMTPKFGSEYIVKKEKERK